MATSALAKQKFKSHASSHEAKEKEPVTPRHDPNAPDAVVLYLPSESYDKRYILIVSNLSSHVFSGKPNVAVVVDPHVAKYVVRTKKERTNYVLAICDPIREQE